MGRKKDHSDHCKCKNKSTGEQRNGRLSPFKNYNIHDTEEPNEYLSKKDL